MVKFTDEWSALETWFEQLSVLKHVDASAGDDDVADVVDGIIQQCLVKDAPQVHTHTPTHTHTDTDTYREWLSPALVLLTVPTHGGMARLSWPGWLI